MEALSVACREAREEASGHRSSVAHMVGRGQQVVDRFERAETWPTGREIDALVNAYAELTRTPARELWERAIERAIILDESHHVSGPSEVAELGDQVSGGLHEGQDADEAEPRSGRDRAAGD